jgi:TrmH family RNA methyltransferase
MISRNELKFIKSLKLKKNRNNEKLFTVEGVKNVLELLTSDFEIKSLYVTDKYKDIFHNQNYSLISRSDLISISSFKNNETCLAVVKQKKPNPLTSGIKSSVIALDGVSDPGNLGTIIRTMDWFGINNLICSMDTADFYNHKTIVSTMGSFTRVIPRYCDLVDTIAKLDLPVYGLSLDGEPLSRTNIVKPSIFVMGSESHGIRKPVSKVIQNPVKIEGGGNAESLNVAIATSILLYNISL